MTDAGRRPCPRCTNLVLAERLEGDDGVTWLWRCACGWAAARTGGDPLQPPQSGVVNRREVNTEIARALSAAKKASPG